MSENDMIESFNAFLQQTKSNTEEYDGILCGKQERLKSIQALNNENIAGRFGIRFQVGKEKKMVYGQPVPLIAHSRFFAAFDSWEHDCHILTEMTLQEGEDTCMWDAFLIVWNLMNGTDSCEVYDCTSIPTLLNIWQIATYFSLLLLQPFTDIWLNEVLIEEIKKQYKSKDEFIANHKASWDQFVKCYRPNDFHDNQSVLCFMRKLNDVAFWN